MTNKKLIEILNRFPPNATIWTSNRNYDGDSDDVEAKRKFVLLQPEDITMIISSTDSPASHCRMMVRETLHVPAERHVSALVFTNNEGEEND